MRGWRVVAAAGVDTTAGTAGTVETAVVVLVVLVVLLELVNVVLVLVGPVVDVTGRGLLERELRRLWLPPLP